MAADPRWLLMLCRATTPSSVAPLRCRPPAGFLGQIRPEQPRATLRLRLGGLSILPILLGRTTSRPDSDPRSHLHVGVGADASRSRHQRCRSTSRYVPSCAASSWLDVSLSGSSTAGPQGGIPSCLQILLVGATGGLGVLRLSS